jgi:hypothetical protein
LRVHLIFYVIFNSELIFFFNQLFWIKLITRILMFKKSRGKKITCCQICPIIIKGVPTLYNFSICKVVTVRVRLTLVSHNLNFDFWEKLKQSQVFIGCKLLTRLDGLIWPDPIWSENKWVGYGFDFIDPNRVGSGSGRIGFGSTQHDPINYIFLK